MCVCVCRRDLPFSDCAHLKNPWNEGKLVKVGRDGQVCNDTDLVAMRCGLSQTHLLLTDV